MRDGRPVALLVHRPGLLDDPALVDEIAAAARLALENERLQAQVRAQLEDLRASRARIVEQGDAERRRLERDLHDGAQQRLVALALSLRLAARRGGTGTDRALEEAEARSARPSPSCASSPTALPGGAHRGGPSGGAGGAGRTGPTPCALGPLPRGALRGRSRGRRLLRGRRDAERSRPGRAKVDAAARTDGCVVELVDATADAAGAHRPGGPRRRPRRPARGRRPAPAGRIRVELPCG